MLIDSPALPKLCNLAEILSEYQVGDEFSVDSVMPEFTEIVRAREPQLFLEYEIKKMVTDHLHVTNGDLNLVEMFRTDRVGMFIYTLDPVQLQGGDIWTAPNDYLYSLLTPNREVIVEKYVYPKDWDVNIYNENIKLINAGHYHLHPGKVESVSRNRDVLRFRIKEPVAILKLVDLQGANYQWMFDATSLSPRLISASMPSQSRVDMLVDVANVFYRNGYVGSEITTFFERLCRHPMHNIRWKAIQSLYRISKTHGRAVLDRALGDPHPHVSEAAAKSLRRLSKGATQSSL